MYKNIGKKIKALAVISFIIGAVASIVGAIVLFVLSQEWGAPEEVLIASGIMLIIIGPLVSWIGSFLIYGYGELVQRTINIEEFVKIEYFKPDQTQKNNTTTFPKTTSQSNIANTNKVSVKKNTGVESNRPQENKPKTQKTENVISDKPLQNESSGQENVNIYSYTDQTKTPVQESISSKQEILSSNEVPVQVPVKPVAPTCKEIKFFCTNCGHKINTDSLALTTYSVTVCQNCKKSINNQWIIEHFAQKS